MAKVAVHDFSSSSTIAHCASKLQFESTTKRKTPLELRGEQLKRKQFGDPVEGSSSPLFGGDCEIRHGQKKAESTKTPRYIDTRVDDVFPVKKFNDLLRIHSEKQKKTFAHLNQENALSARGIILKSPFEACHLAVKKEGPLPCTSGSHSGQKCSESTFRSVAELSRGSEASGNPLDFDMDKALKGLGTYNLFTVFPMIANSTGIFGGFLIITLFENCLS
ncbi:uncharacterized protein LOC18430617 isoform X1 [Amborella trichopoda]|uniref:uncharacterized protein LOC18430617 isoform X1 n=1 Tax=Amborella trichopoda TaxID=13333 RepID=UPI0009BF7708|nr:uncharacterized protein LOC18430617 isoform X1 [Amborella trichopoda]|eukprot:XP_020520766.1 uncharacterized protein LOC18430617 isoform X1 [Amborella trichopoda]